MLPNIDNNTCVFKLFSDPLSVKLEMKLSQLNYKKLHRALVIPTLSRRSPVLHDLSVLGPHESVPLESEIYHSYLDVTADIAA